MGLGLENCDPSPWEPNIRSQTPPLCVWLRSAMELISRAGRIRGEWRQETRTLAGIGNSDLQRDVHRIIQNQVTRTGLRYPPLLALQIISIKILIQVACIYNAPAHQVNIFKSIFQGACAHFFFFLFCFLLQSIFQSQDQKKSMNTNQRLSGFWLITHHY